MAQVRGKDQIFGVGGKIFVLRDKYSCHVRVPEAHVAHVRQMFHDNGNMLTLWSDVCSSVINNGRKLPWNHKKREKRSDVKISGDVKFGPVFDV